MTPQEQEMWKEIARLNAIIQTLKNHFEQQSFLIGRLTARVNALERRKE